MQAIRIAIERAAERFDLEAFAEVVEREILLGALLGTLDSQYEREHDVILAPATFAQPSRAPFAQQPFNAAVKLWEQRQVLPRAAFDALQQGARRQAFTIAGLASEELLNAAHAELGRLIQSGGTDLAQFKKFVKERLESAGWTPENKSHVETIFRTNVASAYSSGRFVEMSQPAVRAAMPYWQILGVNDSRARRTHRAAHGIILLASDPFWRHAYPPFGYNCRCRVCARSKYWFDRNGGKLGPVPKGLPDPGFDSGTTRLLLPVPDAVLKPAAPKPAPAPTPVPAAPTRPQVDLPALPPPGTAPPISVALPPPLPPPPAATSEDFAAAGITVQGRFEAIQEAAKQALGRELTPDFVRRLAGTEGATSKVKYSVNRAVSEGRTKVVVEASLRDLADKEVGELSREYYRDAEGRLVVHHAFFKLDDNLRGGGIGKRVLRRQLDEYEALGATKIVTEAAWDGQYVWPRMGFRLRDPAQLDGYKQEFRAYLERNSKLPEAEIDSLLNGVRSIHDLSLKASDVDVWVGDESRLSDYKTKLADMLRQDGARRNQAEEALEREIGDILEQVQSVADLQRLEIWRSEQRKLGKQFLMDRGYEGRGLIKLELPLDPDSPEYQTAKSWTHGRPR